MKVKDLKKLLRKMPADAEVVVAADAEQSDFAHLAYVDLGYWDQHEYHGDFHDNSAVGDPETEWEPTEDSVTAVCLTPEG